MLTNVYTRLQHMSDVRLAKVPCCRIFLISDVVLSYIFDVRLAKMLYCHTFVAAGQQAHGAGAQAQSFTAGEEAEIVLPVGQSHLLHQRARHKTD